MSRLLAIALAAVAGSLVGLQAPVNARLARTVGDLQAASISFLVGTVVLLSVTALSSGGLSDVVHAGRAPWWALIGGVFGAVFVTVALLTVHTLGASGLTAITVAGQVAIAVVLDRFGLLGLPKQHIASSRLLGLVLLLAGVALVVRR